MGESVGTNAGASSLAAIALRSFSATSLRVLPYTRRRFPSETSIAFPNAHICATAYPSVTMPAFPRHERTSFVSVDQRVVVKWLLRPR